MELNLNKITEKLEQNEFVKSFITELGKALENFSNKNTNPPSNQRLNRKSTEFFDLHNKNNTELKGEKMNDSQLTSAEELEFERKKFTFLQDYFEKELLNLSKGEIYIVTNKYENDNEYHRYKVAQYKDNLECKYIVFEKDLPKNVQLGDVVRKIDGKYIYDRQATKYVNASINKIKQNIINNRDLS